MRAERKSIVKAKDFVDRVEAISPVEIRARVTGYLDEVLFKEGDLITEGAPLYVLKRDRFKAQADLAEATLGRSKVAKIFSALRLARAEELLGKRDHMPLASANGIEIFYHDVGDPNAPAVLLIMGLATQMIGWPEAFCGRLADRGFRVIRFDNRDIGLSTKIENAPKVDIQAAFLRAFAGQPVPAPYNLDDMAKDAIGLMDALGVARAHVVGASMGGMIAQIMAAKQAARTRSLVSIMSTSGDPKLPQPNPAVAAVLTATRPPGSDREASIQFGMNVYRVIGSPRSAADNVGGQYDKIAGYVGSEQPTQAEEASDIHASCGQAQHDSQQIHAEPRVNPLSRSFIRQNRVPEKRVRAKRVPALSHGHHRTGSPTARKKT